MDSEGPPWTHELIGMRMTAALLGNPKAANDTCLRLLKVWKIQSQLRLLGLRFSIFFSSGGLTRLKRVCAGYNLFCHAGNLCVTPLDFSSLQAGGE